MSEFDTLDSHFGCYKIWNVYVFQENVTYAGADGMRFYYFLAIVRLKFVDVYNGEASIKDIIAGGILEWI